MIVTVLALSVYIMIDYIRNISQFGSHVFKGDNLFSANLTKTLT